MDGAPKKPRRIQRLSVRMTLYYSVVIFVTFLTLAALISSLFAGQLMKEMDDVLHRKMGLMDSELKNQMNQVQAFHASLLNDNTLRNSMIQISRSGVDAASMGQVQGRLTHLASQVAYVSSIVAFDRNQNILHSYYSLPPYSNLVAKSEDFQLFHQSARTRSFTRPDSFPVAMGSEDSSSITYLGILYDPVNDYETLGSVAINLKSHFLFSALAPLAVDSFDACFLTDAAGGVVYSTAREGFAHLGLADIDDTCRVYSTPVDGYPDWTLTCVVREQKFRSGLQDMYQVVMGMCLVALGAGQYPEMSGVKAVGEMQDLLAGFSTMVGDLRRLTDETIAQQKKEKAYEVAMVQNQLDLLQLQINPHFIHNTLNSMKYMAQTAHNDELVQTITAFNALLRASMSSSKAHATVAEEIDNTQNYLHLQRGRYDFAIGFAYEIDPEAQFAMLPKLILQPIVENALFHGIAPADGGTTITARFEKRDGTLAVIIADDGVGIPAERLVLLYGQESRLQVTSAEGTGTTVSFQIPFTT